MPNINGTGGNDTIDVTNDVGVNTPPTPGSPTTVGPPVDNIAAGNGDDTVTIDNSDLTQAGGNSGRIRGQGGDDTISVENGSTARAIRGNTGNDTISVTDGSTIDRSVLSDDGDDKVDVAGSSVGLDIQAGAGSDTVTISNSDVTRNVTGNAGNDEITLVSATVGGNVNAGGDDDTVNILGSFSANAVNGGGGIDALNLPVGTVITLDSDPTNPITVALGISYNLTGETGTFQVPGGSPVPFSNFETGAGITCFTRGALIDTPEGMREIETLSVGDYVSTFENSPQPIRWIGSRLVQQEELEQNPKLRPVRIMAGSLGLGLPNRDLLVSRQHRMLVRSRIAERMFGETEVLIPAIKLIELPGVYIDPDATEVEYFHILLDQHDVVYAEGAPSESLFTGPEVLKTMGNAALQEIYTLFPELADGDQTQALARLVPSGKRQKQLVMRHAKNNRSLLGEF